MQNFEEKYIIVGCGGHARSIADVILYNDYNADIIFLDKNARHNEKILGFPVVSSYDITNEKVIVGLGDNLKRKELSLMYYDNLSNVISKTAYIGKSVQLGKGIFIAHNAHVGVMSKIEDFSIINTGASIDHECFLEKASFIAPNATLCGKVMVGENSFIGAGATVIPEIKICKNSTIGAEAVIIRNITEEGTYVGNPAEKI